MADPTVKAADTGAFGAVGESAAAGVSASGPGDTSQDERPTKPLTPDDDSGTTHTPARLGRPVPSDEPLGAQFGTEA